MIVSRFRGPVLVIFLFCVVACGLVEPAVPTLGPVLTVAPAGSMVGYDRGLFGSGWADVDRDGCDTRSEVLIRDLTAETLGARCRVLTGDFVDPYTGAQGRVLVRSLDADHVVALGDAWKSGAASWPRSRRVAFANWEPNLLATAATVNRAKSDLGPDRWQPSSEAGRCRYVAVYATAKAHWGLTVTVAERDAVVTMRGRC